MFLTLVVGMITFIAAKMIKKQSVKAAFMTSLACAMVMFLLQFAIYFVYFSINGLPS